MEQTRDGLTCVTCPICGEVVTTAVQSHVEKCLEKFKRTELSASRQEACICVVCRTDITNLDASQRTAHVNRCLDKECNEPVQEPVVSTPSHTAGASFELLDCPLCDRGFKSSKACKVHIKQCSTQLNMSPKQVMDAIRLQQRYLHERLAAGLPLIHRRKPISDEPVHRPSKRPRPAATIPKSKFQEEIQMAKALSASMTAKDENGSRERRNQQVLGHANNRGKKSKREAKPTPALLTTTSEERTRITENKISRLLASSMADSLEKHNCSIRRSWTSLIKPSCRLRELAEEGLSVLWTKATQCTAQKEQFYVATLSSTVTPCNLEAGSKLRSLSQVAGHRISDAAAQFQHLDERYANFLETQKPVTEETATQDHQAAVLSLIEGSLQPGTTLGNVGYGFLTQEPSAARTEESWESNSLRQLSCDLNNRVGASRYADLRISVAGGKTVHAHRIIVYTRCPSLENDVIKSNGVNCLNWSEWSETCVRTFLSYLYGGTVDVKIQDKELTLQLRSLAFRYNLNSICKFLEERLGDSLDKQASLDSSLAGIITSLWDEEAVPQNSSEKVEEAPTDDDDSEAFDDVYEFVASQRPQKSKEDVTLNQSQANHEGFPQPQSSQPQLLPMSQAEYKGFPPLPHVLAASRVDYERFSQPLSSQPQRPQPSIPTESPKDYGGFPEPRPSQQTQPRLLTANQAEYKKFSQPQPSQPQKPQPRIPTASQVDYKGFPEPQPSQPSPPQSQLLTASEVDYEGFPQPQFPQPRQPQPRVPTPSQAAYRGSPEPQPSQHRLPTESQADYKRFPHQPASQPHRHQLRLLSTSQTDFEGFPRSQQPQPEHSTANKEVELQTPMNLSGGSSHSSPTKHLTPSYSTSSVPIAISPIHSEDELLRVVPSKILSLPLPPMENGQAWYSPGSVQNAPSTADSSNEHNASDAGSEELFGSCEEVESNPDPLRTGDSDAEQPMELSGDNSSSSRSVQSTEDKQASDQGDQDDIWDSVWEGFGDQGHCEIPELVLSPIGESKDSEVMSDTKEVVLQEQFGAEEAVGRSVHSAMLDSHFFDEEACNQAYQSPLRSRGRTPVSAVTPLPDYNAMQTPELKGQLQRFGLRAFPRKKAVNILRHIYEETHPYADQTPRRPPSHSSSASQPNLSRGRCADSGEPSQSSGAGDDYTESRSSSSSGTDFGELETQADGEEGDVHSEVDVHSKMREFVRTDQQLYQRILSYEPIELRTLHTDMKAAKIKVSLKVLMDFLDQQCITFRLPRPEKQQLKQQRRQNRFRQRVRAKIASSQA